MLFSDFCKFLFMCPMNAVISIFRCPVYYNLPPQCILAKKANGCCLEPVCNFNGKYGTTSGQTTGKFNGVGKRIKI